MDISGYVTRQTAVDLNGLLLSKVCSQGTTSYFNLSYKLVTLFLSPMLRNHFILLDEKESYSKTNLTRSILFV